MKFLNSQITVIPKDSPRYNDSKFEAETKVKVSQYIQEALNGFKKSERGVYVQASTLGSLEALMDYLKESDVPVSGVSIGPVKRKDVIKASAMRQYGRSYAVILAFDVPIQKSARASAVQLEVEIFEADVIYHLTRAFKEHIDKVGFIGKEFSVKFLMNFNRKSNPTLYIKVEEKRCLIYLFSIQPENILRAGPSPIIIGVRVEGGYIEVGTTLTIPHKKFMGKFNLEFSLNFQILEE